MSRGKSSGQSRPSGGGSVRIQKVERSLREIISSFIITQLNLDLPGLVSVPQVKVTADLRQAKVYISMIPFGGNPSGSIDRDYQATMSEILQVMSERAYEIQNEVAKKLQMKFCPKLRFYADDRVREALKVEGIIDQLAKERNDSGDESR